jgi:hypothetical protein
MCQKCIEVDKTIERFRQVKRSISDQLTVERAHEVIADLEAKKAAFHPDRAAARRPPGMNLRAIAQ